MATAATGAYDHPQLARLKQRLQQRPGNAQKELVKTPLSIRRTLLVAAAYEKLQQKAGDGQQPVTLDVLERFHPGLSVATAETARQCGNATVREFALDFLLCGGDNTGTGARGGSQTALPQDLFTLYFEVVSFYKAAETEFEKVLQTVFLLSPLDLVTMASKRLEAVNSSSQLGHATTEKTPQRRGSFSSVASSREGTSDAENVRPYPQAHQQAQPQPQPQLLPMPTPTPPRARRAASSASLRSKSFMEATASSLAGEWKEAAHTAATAAAGIAAAAAAATARPSTSSSKKKPSSGSKARRHSVDGIVPSPTCTTRGCAEGSAASASPHPSLFVDARGVPVRIIKEVQRAPSTPVLAGAAAHAGLDAGAPPSGTVRPRGAVPTAPADDGVPEQERRRVAEENALLRKKVELLRQKVRSMAEEAAAAAAATTARTAQAPAPAPVVLDRDKAYLDVIAALQATVDAQAATIKGQQEVIRSLTTKAQL